VPGQASQTCRDGKTRTAGLAIDGTARFTRR
jgi:hypothetical protein